MSRLYVFLPGSKTSSLMRLPGTGNPKLGHYQKGRLRITGPLPAFPLRPYRCEIARSLLKISRASGRCSDSFETSTCADFRNSPAGRVKA